MIKLISPLITTVSILALTSQVVLAQATPNGQGMPAVGRPQDKVAQKVDNWTDQAQKWVEKWKGNLEAGANDVVREGRERICTATQNRVGDRWQKYYNARMNRVDNLERGVLALQNRVEFFKSRGLDTARLEADITTLQGLLGDYKAAYTSFLNALEEAKTLSCANYEGKFLGELKEAKDEWTAVRASHQTIRDFYTAQIKPDLKALREQLVEQNLENKED